MNIICVGDNVVDCYIHEGLYYPGGNCLNVAVNAKRFGCENSAYIGVFGDDNKADHLQWVLDKEGIDYKYSRRLYGISGQPKVVIDSKGDRKFVGSPQNTVQHLVKLKMTDEDLNYIANFDLLHTSCYSSLENELNKISKVCDISFDFSDRTDGDYLKEVCPNIKFAFISGTHLTDQEVEGVIKECHKLGTKIVGVTLGERGAVFSDGNKLFKQEVVPVEVVDTMGAGDSFISGFLKHYIQGNDMTSSLKFAASCAAQTCKYNGAIGYPKSLSKNHSNK